MVKVSDTVAKPKARFATVTKSGNPTYFRIGLVGPPKEGKTFTAASASEFWPESLPADKPTELADMLWILTDTGGLDGFAEQGITIPHIDLTHYEGGKMELAMEEAFKVAKERAESGETKTVVVDTMSTADVVYLSGIMARMGDNAADDNKQRSMWAPMLQKNTRVFELARSLPCNVILVFHPKFRDVPATNTPAGQKQAAKMAAEGLQTGVADISITGRAGEYYRGALSMIATVQSTYLNKKRDVAIYPYGTERVAGYCRWSCLDRKEPANLGKVFEKIRNAGAMVASVEKER